MRLATVVPGMRRIRRFLRPLVYRELRVAAMDHDPSNRILALGAANFTSIDRVNHFRPPPPHFLYLVPYSNICKFNGGSSMQSILPIVSIARFSAEDLHGSTVTTNGSACEG